MPESSRSQELQNEIFNTIRRSQEAIVDAIETWASTVQAVRPELPDLNLPFADKLPKPQDLVANAYDFAEQLLSTQRQFAEDVLKATAPLMVTGTGRSAKKTEAAK
jgi:hypothetical protein